MKTKHNLIIVFVIAQLLDIITTMIVVDLLGGIELNPLGGIMPLWAFFIVKLIVVALCSLFLFKHSSGLKVWHYKLACAITIVPVLWNGLNIVVGLVI